VAGRDAFDLIAAPRHDRMKPRANLVETIGAPHRVTAERLAAEAERWQAKLAPLPTPRIAVLVGGATRRRGFTPDLAAELARLASKLAASAGGSLLVTTSRRTGQTAADALVGALAVPAFVHRWDKPGEEGEGSELGNPYFAFLGLCDGVIVTGESVSMCSEACATGKPVYIFAPPAIVKPAFAALHQELYRAGMARPLDKTSAVTFESWHYPPLSVAQEIAAEARRRLAL
jgi:mitochondrial fission protein ELM1